MKQKMSGVKHIMEKKQNLLFLNMFKGFPKEMPYSSWLLTAKHLSPAYDYVDFADSLSSTKENTNGSYSNIMRKALHDAEGEDKTKIADVINTFNVTKCIPQCIKIR